MAPGELWISGLWIRGLWLNYGLGGKKIVAI